MTDVEFLSDGCHALPQVRFRCALTVVGGRLKMERRSAVLETRPETSKTETEKFHVILSQEEVDLVRSGLETMLQIYTRHERCRGLIGGLLAKLPGKSSQN